MLDTLLLVGILMGVFCPTSGGTRKRKGRMLVPNPGLSV